MSVDLPDGESENELATVVVASSSSARCRSKQRVAVGRS